MDITEIVSALHALAEVQGRALERTRLALEALQGHGAELEADPEPEIETVAPKPPRPRPIVEASIKGHPAGAGKSKYDYAAIATVATAALGQGRGGAKAVAESFAVSETMGGFLISEARKKGHHIPKRGDARAITPSHIRKETAPVPASMRIVHTEPNQPITGVAAHAFADRPTHVEHPVETERRGWKPGMGAQLLAGRHGDDGDDHGAA